MSSVKYVCMSVYVFVTYISSVFLRHMQQHPAPRIIPAEPGYAQVHQL
jgi:hypothetical protein